MVIEGGCRPVKVQSEGWGGGAGKGEEQRERELLERGGFHSAEKHVHFS